MHINRVRAALFPRSLNVREGGDCEQSSITATIAVNANDILEGFFGCDCKSNPCLLLFEMCKVANSLAVATICLRKKYRSPDLLFAEVFLAQ